MFNLFKKNKRSAWMEGLLNAEEMVQDGELEDALLWYDIHPMFLGFEEENKGFVDYLDYYEKNLKNI